MHDVVRLALKTALRGVLSVLERFPMRRHDIHTIWRREKPGTWTTTTELRPSLIPVFINGPVDWEQFAAGATEAFKRQYPEYLGVIGTAAGTLSLSPANLLQIMIGRLWKRHGTWSLDDGVIDVFLDEFAHAIDDPIISVAFVAQLLNFHTDLEISSIPLPLGLAIRRLTEDEFSEIYGVSSPVESLTFLPRPRFIHEFAIAGEYEIRKLVNEPLPQTAPYADLRSTLARAVLALRTFKNGRVGYDIVNLRPRYFCPYLYQDRIGGIEYVPMGLYQLSKDDVSAFQEHARLIFAELHPSLEIACSRLGDAETRLQPRDAIMDAVIGLEAILLAQAGREQYRGEMRYRFSLNYSTFFTTPEARHSGFHAVRSLYDLRSTIAHGGQLQESIGVGDRKMTLHQAAELACEILRAAIKRFLPGGSSPAYLRQDYWERACFGLPAGG